MTQLLSAAEKAVVSVAHEGPSSQGGHSDITEQRPTLRRVLAVHDWRTLGRFRRNPGAHWQDYTRQVAITGVYLTPLTFWDHSPARK